MARKPSDGATPESGWKKGEKGEGDLRRHSEGQILVNRI